MAMLIESGATFRSNLRVVLGEQRHPSLGLLWGLGSFCTSFPAVGTLEPVEWNRWSASGEDVWRFTPTISNLSSMSYTFWKYIVFLCFLLLFDVLFIFMFFGRYPSAHIICSFGSPLKLVAMLVPLGQHGRHTVHQQLREQRSGRLPLRQLRIGRVVGPAEYQRGEHWTKMTASNGKLRRT